MAPHMPAAGSTNIDGQCRQLRGPGVDIRRKADNVLPGFPGAGRQDRPRSGEYGTNQTFRKYR